MIESPRFNYITEIRDAPWNVAIIRQTIIKVFVSYVLNIILLRMKHVPSILALGIFKF